MQFDKNPLESETLHLMVSISWTFLLFPYPSLAVGICVSFL